MFDFPSSPTLGQTFSSAGVTYTWNGYAWSGGQLAQQQSEQFFTLDGLTTLDIPVPTWAKHAVLTGCVPFNGAVQQVGCRVSGDGSTFAAGASDYSIIGPTHNTGSNAYQSQAQTSVNMMVLSAVTDAANILPIQFTFDLQLTRPNTGHLFSGKTYSKASNTGATLGSQTHWWNNWVNAVATTSLTIKALRLLQNANPFPAGSYVQVKWLGSSGQIPISNAIVEAPNDGLDYVRNNGVWRPAGVARLGSGGLASAVPTVDIATPGAGYNLVEVLITGMVPVTDASQPGFRFSLDGSTFVTANYATAYNTLTSGAANTPSGIPSGGGITLATAVSNNTGTPAYFRIQLPQHPAAMVQNAIFDGAIWNGTNYCRIHGMGTQTGLAGMAQLVRLYWGNAGNFDARLKWQVNGYR